MSGSLQIRRDPNVPELLLVFTEDGRNVYKWNTKHAVGTRTHHEGVKPSMREIRSALASA